MTGYLAVGCAYLLGSLPFGYILGLLFKRIDIRTFGSGNIGTTNVIRLLGWRGGLLVFILDAAKGAGAVLLARALTPDTAFHLAAAFAALLGHCFPVFLGFRGGKGAATGIGVLFPLAGWLAALLLLIFAVVIGATRYVSLGSMIGALSLPFFFYFFGYDAPYIYFGAATALLLIGRHHANIGRLLKGEEPKIGRKPGSPPEGAS